jgi:nitrogen regulatory protein PII
MTRLDAIVRSHSLQCVKDRIVPFGVEGWTVSEVGAFGPQRRHTQNLSGRRVCGDFVPKSMVPILATVDRSGATFDALFTGRVRGRSATETFLSIYSKR